MRRLWPNAIHWSLISSAIALGPGWTFVNAQTPSRSPSGMALYQSKCGGCHSLDANRIGPSHRGVVGRKPGSAAGYAYSPALKKLGGVWTPARLDAWLKGPQKVAPGSKMFLSVSDPATRAGIIAYLQSVSPPAAARRK